MTKWTDKPWERQKGESSQAYEAFSIYINMGPDRNLRAVAQKCAKNSSLIRRWSSGNNWQERVRAYDNELGKKARAKAAKEREAMTERHIGIAMQLQKKALEALNSLNAEKMSFKDVKEFIKMATDLERLNRTLEEDSVKSKDNESTQLADTIIAAYKKRMRNDDDE